MRLCLPAHIKGLTAHLAAHLAPVLAGSLLLTSTLAAVCVRCGHGGCLGWWLLCLKTKLTRLLLSGLSSPCSSPRSFWASVSQSEGSAVARGVWEGLLLLSSSSLSSPSASSRCLHTVTMMLTHRQLVSCHNPTVLFAEPLQSCGSSG